MKTLRGKFARAIIIIFCLIFVFISASVYVTIGVIYKNREVEILTNTTERLSIVSAGIMGRTSAEGLLYSEFIEEIYEEDIETYSQNTGYYILTVDRYDRIIFVSSNAKKIVYENGVPHDEIINVLEGNSVNGNYTLSVFYGTKVITVARPVCFENEVIGAVFCSMPTDYLFKLRMGTVFSILVGLFPLLVAVLLFAYYISVKITKPISDVSKAAKLISNGDFSQRVSAFAGENELNELAENFNEMARALENSDKMKNSFISDVSHELRTPMTSIIGFLQAIKDGVVPADEQGKYIDICLAESRRLSRLVNRLLDITRLETDGKEPEFISFDINDMLRNTVFKFEEQITLKKIIVHADFSETNLNVMADSDGIERVLTNLLDNAVKFTQENGKIYINTVKLGDKVQVTVANSGEGIDSDEINEIWNKFYKGDKSRSSDKTGTGLGLYFVKKILAGHNERITVSCEENSAEQTIYTIFKFKLKLTEKES